MATEDKSPAPHDPSAGAAYPPVDETRIAYVEVFPAIGIARMGNSGFDSNTGQRSGPVSYFLGPEFPGTVYAPEGGFRDAKQAIKRQGCRFRVYAYDSDGNILGEINAKNGYTLNWTVDVANIKPASHLFSGIFTDPQPTALRNPDIQPDLPIYERSRLVIKPEKPITISGTKMTAAVIGKFQGSRDSPAKAVDVDLGDAKTDDTGRLVFVGGSGWSQCITESPGFKPDAEYPLQPEVVSEFDGVDWFDSACDGRISVQISKGSITRKSRHDAWVLSGPPDFAWGIDSPTTLWDVMEDIYNKNSPSFVADREVRFYRDIWPVLTTTYATSWTNKDALQGHGPSGKGNFLEMEDALKNTSNTALHSHVFGRIRMPEYLNPDQSSTKWMPRLSGDGGDAIEPGTILPAARQANEIRRFASLTSLQYERFKRWAQGDFSDVPYPERKTTRLEDLPINDQPEYLTRATLDTTIGDPLYPGIETYWIAKTKDVYDFSVDGTVRPPFRIKASLHPGDMSKGLSLPWQSDFSLCEQHWWPSARPDDVVSEYDFLHLVPSVVRDKKSFADVLDSVPRRHWTYPMRVTPDNLSSFYPGSTDMVRMWEALGFVTRIDFPGQLPVWIEVQRLLPTDTGGDVVPKEAPTAQDVQTALGANSQWKLNSKGKLVPSTQS